MGYGLRSDVPALVNRDRQFDIVPDHYRAFSLEPGPNSSMDLNVYYRHRTHASALSSSLSSSLIRLPIRRPCWL
jgi:hypothetical protein